MTYLGRALRIGAGIPQKKRNQFRARPDQLGYLSDAPSDDVFAVDLQEAVAGPEAGGGGRRAGVHRVHPRVRVPLAPGEVEAAPGLRALDFQDAQRSAGAVVSVRIGQHAGWLWLRCHISIWLEKLVRDDFHLDFHLYAT